jgi:hypothetical protein
MASDRGNATTMLCLIVLLFLVVMVNIMSLSQAGGCKILSFALHYSLDMFILIIQKLFFIIMCNMCMCQLCEALTTPRGDLR